MSPRDHPTKVTYWKFLSVDGFGKSTFATPKLVDGRWEEKSELFRDGQGREVVSRAKVFLEDAVSLGDYLFNGESTVADPTTLSKAFEVAQYQELPDLRYLTQERLAFL